MRRFFVRLLAGIGALTVVLVVILVIVVTSGPSVPDHAVLVVDFRRGLLEHVPESPVARLTRAKALTLRGARR